MKQEFPSSQQNISNVSIGDSNVITFNQTQILQISVEKIKTRQFIQTSPYKGLKKFESVDKDLFFGRDQFLTGLVNELEQTNLILLLGASGSGKSSLVRAGLIPWLSQKWGSQLVNLAFSPDNDPFESLYASLLSKYKQTEAQIAREVKANTLVEVVKRLKQPDDYWFIFIDQFEELFTVSLAEKRDKFIASLVQLSKISGNSVKIMATMRADFLDRLSPYAQLVKTTDKHRPLIAEMQPDELRLAIEQPAAHHGVVFETGLVEEIIKNIQGQAGYLPLLQYTLNLLWETEVQTSSINDRTLNISTYRELGGVRGALEKHIDQIYNGLLEPEKLATQRIFLKLVDIGENSKSSTEWKPVRRRANRFEFSDEVEQRVVARLINENLLVSDGKLQSQSSTVEIAHEILLTSWKTLTDWIKENRQAVALRNRLNDDTAHWKAIKSEYELWTGSKLEQALELQKDPIFNKELGGFSPDANQFIAASLGLRDRQRRRAIVGLASFSTIALLLCAIAIWQLRAAEKRRVEQTALTGKLLLATEPLKGMVNALSAVTLSQSPLLNLSNPTLSSSVQNSLFSAVQISREKDVLKGHRDSVRSIAISTDGNTIVSGGNDGTVRLWNRSGQPIGEPFTGHQGSINSVAISTDGNTIVSGGNDATVRLWNRDGQPIGEPFTGHQSSINSVAISTDGNTIVSGADNSTLRVWNRSGQLIREQFTGSRFTSINSVVTSTDGNTIVSGGVDGLVRLWNRSGQLIGKPFRRVQGQIQTIAISTDGNTIVSGEDDGTIRLWNRSGQLIGKPFKSVQGSVNSIAISTDGNTIVSGGEDGTIRLWNRSGQSIDEPFIGHQGYVNSVAISTDGSTIFSGGEDGTVRLWNRSGQPIDEPFIGHQGDVRSVAISTEVNTIVSGATDGTVRIWNRSGQPIGKPFQGDYDSHVYSVAISADGNTIVGGWLDGTVRLLNSNGKLIGKPFIGHQGGVTSVAIDAEGKTIVSGDNSSTVRLWNRDGQPIGEPFTGHQGSVNSVAISTDGNTIVSGDKSGTVRLWNRDGQPIGEPFTGHQGSINSVAISTDRNTIVSGGDDGTVRLWNRDGQPIGEPFTVYQSRVNSVAISTNGNTIVSGSSDGTVRLWNRNGQPIGEPFTGHQGSVNSVAISTDGNRIVSGGLDGTVRMWDINFEDWLKIACERMQEHPALVGEAKTACKQYLR